MKVDDEPVEVVLGPGGIAVDTNVSNRVIQPEGDEVRTERVKKTGGTSPPDALPTIFEIAGVDSSTYDALPEDVQQQLLDHLSPRKRNQSPVGAYLRSERRVKLREAGAASDFEMQQLHQQIAMTQRYTSEIVEMRRKQTQLEERLKKEKLQLAARNEQLLRELRKIDVSKAQIAQSEVEVATLASRYNAQLLSLGQQRDQLTYALTQLGAHQARPNFLSPTQQPIETQKVHAPSARLPHLVTASISDASSSTVPTEIRLK